MLHPMLIFCLLVILLLRSKEERKCWSVEEWNMKKVVEGWEKKNGEMECEERKVKKCKESMQGKVTRESWWAYEGPWRSLNGIWRLLEESLRSVKGKERLNVSISLKAMGKKNQLWGHSS